MCPYSLTRFRLSGILPIDDATIHVAAVKQPAAPMVPSNL